MSIRLQLEKKVENKKQEISELESKLREANAFLQGLQEALKILPREGIGEDRAPEQILRLGSNMAKIRDYLRKIGKPAHISELLKHLDLEASRNNRASISGSLGSYARKGTIFTHTGPNVFGLVEFGGSQSEDEPPDDFGMDEEEETRKSKKVGHDLTDGHAVRYDT